MSRHTHAQFSIMTNISSIIQTLAFTLIILTPSLCQAFWTSTHYNTLNVDSQASKKEIKSAYRKLALKYHPDRNSDESAKQQFLEISKAGSAFSAPIAPFQHLFQNGKLKNKVDVCRMHALECQNLVAA